MQAAHRYITLTAKRKVYGTRKTQIYDGRARPSQQGKQRPHPVGRQDPTGKQRPSPGGQRPSPARAPTRTSRRAGISQGDLPHTKVATSASRMHGNYKEQYGSHSLNRWKERLALQHRHAGMSTGSEPYILRGILSEGAQALMTRLGPSHDEGPGTQSHIGPMLVSEFSVRIHHTTFYQCYDNVFRQVSVRICYTAFYQYYEYNVTMCSIELSTKESEPMVRTMTQYYIHQGESPTSVIPWKCESYQILEGIKGIKEPKGIS